MTPANSTPSDSQKLERERLGLLRQVEHAMEIPMMVLGLAWLGLLIAELTGNTHRALETAGVTIWIIFIADFLLKLALAPAKGRFIRRQWLTVLSLAVPALRVLRIARLVRLLRMTRAVRGLRLFRLVSSLNRGFRALRASMGRRGFGYVVALAVVVVFAGAAGMLAFEQEEPGGLQTYAGALWWTAMMITTVGSDYFPRSPEGRILCLLLATFAFTIWGYLTATLATFFLGRDAATAKPVSEGSKEMAALREEVRALRASLDAVATELQRR